MTDHFAKIHSALLNGRLGDARQALDDALLAARRGGSVGPDLLAEPTAYPAVAALPADIGQGYVDRIRAFNELAAVSR